MERTDSSESPGIPMGNKYPSSDFQEFQAKLVDKGLVVVAVVGIPALVVSVAQAFRDRKGRPYCFGTSMNMLTPFPRTPFSPRKL